MMKKLKDEANRGNSLNILPIKSTEMNDPITKRIFNKKIKSRVKNEPESLVYYLLKYKFFDIFTEKEILKLKIRVLNLSNLGDRQETIIPFIIYIKNLQILDLSWNKFITFPDSIRTISSLKELSLAHNQLDNFPKSICNLTSLQILDLRGNNLTSLPNSIKDLSSLKILWLQENRLSKLPESIADLKSLRLLDISYNNLNQLPDSIKNLTSLKILILGKNPIYEKPDLKMKSIMEELMEKDVQIFRSLNLKKQRVRSSPTLMS
ncbi:MAG: leucine-rich repeat domain-containing protein [Candidatus Hodarchaeota archaeon]